jgi:hypothetical protein
MKNAVIKADEKGGNDDNKILRENKRMRRMKRL